MTSLPERPLKISSAPHCFAMNTDHLPAFPRRLTTGAVLLAAGAGSRLGHQPKSLLQLDGVPLIHRQLVALSSAGIDEIVVVLGHHAVRIEAAVRACTVSAKVQSVINPSPDDGQPSSVRVGLRSLSERLDAVIVALADQPLLNTQDVSALMSAFKHRRDGASMLVPRVSGLPGNPVIFDATLAADWLRGDTNVMGRTWREANPQRVQWLDTENAHYRVDIDTPEDILQFAERTGHTLRWPEP
jgi:molybdenum cofactor cytidylyltransferase